MLRTSAGREFKNARDAEFSRWKRVDAESGLSFARQRNFAVGDESVDRGVASAPSTAFGVELELGDGEYFASAVGGAW